MRAREFISEGRGTNALIAALIAALSTSAHADEYREPSTAAKALGIVRMINNYKDYGRAGLEGEARQEVNNILRSIQGHPNQSRLLPIIKDMIKTPDTEQLPPLMNPEDEVR